MNYAWGKWDACLFQLWILNYGENYGDTPFIFSSVRLGVANFARFVIAKLAQHFSRHFS
jgi:hypothetical protein